MLLSAEISQRSHTFRGQFVHFEHYKKILCSRNKHECTTWDLITYTSVLVALVEYTIPWKTRWTALGSLCPLPASGPSLRIVKFLIVTNDFSTGFLFVSTVERSKLKQNTMSKLPGICGLFLLFPVSSSFEVSKCVANVVLRPFILNLSYFGRFR